MDIQPQQRKGVICFLQRDERYLLAHIAYSETDKKWSGIGGFVNEDETLTMAVAREIREEIDAEVVQESLQHVGKIIENNELTLHIFIATEWIGEIKSNEPSIIDLQWFTEHDVPYDEMWSDNAYWLPEILSGKIIVATVLRDIYTDIKPLTERDVEIREVAEIT